MPLVNISLGTIKAVTIYAHASSCSLSRAYQLLDSAPYQSQVGTSHTAKRHDSTSYN